MQEPGMESGTAEKGNEKGNDSHKRNRRQMRIFSALLYIAILYIFTVVFSYTYLTS